MPKQSRKGTKQQTGQTAGVFAFTLPAMVTIHTVSEMAESLKNFDFSEGCQLSIDASQVEVITSPGIQLLLSVAASVKAQGGDMKVTGAAEPFIHACSTLGVISQLTMEGI